MYIAIPKVVSGEFVIGMDMHQLLNNAIDTLSDVSTWEDLEDNYNIHELGKPLIVNRIVHYEITTQE